jgi:hypothetical protein
MKPIHLDQHALDAGIAAYSAFVGSYARHQPDRHIASSEQLADGITVCIRAYLAALPSDDLIDQLRHHADAEIHNTLRYIVGADRLMREAADQIAMLEAELVEDPAKPLRERNLAAESRGPL